MVQLLLVSSSLIGTAEVAQQLYLALRVLSGLFDRGLLELFEPFTQLGRFVYRGLFCRFVCSEPVAARSLPVPGRARD